MIANTLKMKCNKVIPLVLDKNRYIIFGFMSTWISNIQWYLINKKGIKILIFKMTLDKF